MSKIELVLNKNNIINTVSEVSRADWWRRWLYSTNAKDIGMCAAKCFMLVLNIIWSIFSNILGIYHLIRWYIYLSYNIAWINANNLIYGVADIERNLGNHLPGLYKIVKEFWYDYDKKLDTLGLPWVKLYILSRILRYIIGIANKGHSDLISYLKAENHSSEESPIIRTQAQGSKPKKTMFESKKDSKEKNGSMRKASDLTAESPKEEISKLMRGRNSHSSLGSKGPKFQKTKGSSKKSSNKKTKVSQLISNQTLRTFVQLNLNSYKTKEGKYNGIIRILADPAFLQFCYLLIKGKSGNMSKGITKETLDGISFNWFEETAKLLLTGRYSFTPARRVMIPKPGKVEKRPLNVGSPREKIIQKGLQMILEAIYEPDFLDCPHGFRPNRSAHSALRSLYIKGHHHTWVIQGDISKCFDNIPHNIILTILKKKIKCDKFLTILNKSLKVGYVNPDTKTIQKSNLGTPQGSVLSPLLANIVLQQLDNYLINTIIPKYTKGKRRKTNPEYNALIKYRYSRKGIIEGKNSIDALKKMRTIRRMSLNDPEFRRAMYIRYADDFVFLLEGPKIEALAIRDTIKDFLKENIGLELNMMKTLITNLKEGFNFLGANIKKLKNVDFRMKTKTVKGNPITMRAHTRLRINMPTKILIEKLITSGFARRNHLNQILAKPYTGLVNLDHATILQFYNSKVHGLLNYYSFAGNRIETQNLIWIFRLSLAKTLARKFKLRSARQAFKKFGPYLKDEQTDLQFILPKSLPTIHHYNIKTNLTPITKLMDQTWYGRLTKSNLFRNCAICGTSSNVQMHHIRSVKDVRTKMKSNRTSFRVWIGATQRKQIPLCQYHHSLYHNGELLNYELNLIARYSENLSAMLKNEKSS